MQVAKQMGKAQERSKRNYDATTRPAIPDLQVRRHVIVRLERTDGKMPEEKKGRRRHHKLAPIATGPHEVVEFSEDTVVIKRGIEVERVWRDRVVNAPVQKALVNAPNAPASADTTRVDTGERLPAQPLPKSEILDVPPIGYSVHTREPLGIPNLGHGSVSPQFIESHHGAMPGDIADVGATPVESTTPTSNTPRDVSVSHDGRITENAARCGKDRTVREEPQPAKEGERTVNDSSPNVDVRQTEEDTVISEDIPESEKREDGFSSFSDATVSEAIVEGPHSVQKTVSADSVSVGAATKKGITPTLPAIVSPDERPTSSKSLKQLKTVSVDSAQEKSDQPNGNVVVAKPSKTLNPRRLVRYHTGGGTAPRHPAVEGLPARGNSSRLTTQVDAFSRDVPKETSSHRDTVRSNDSTAKTQEYVMEDIVDHYTDDEDHCLRYRTRWYRYPPESDTWEPIENLPRSHIHRYCKRYGPAIPEDINSTMVG
ncbi:hypothetical protein BWQ96_08072 [Gracilariopsis chorda]|uniref:Chromo domain-containing protein n=1 Tax=Gracilariopsis chorda TaxID=448386 RepID=A0A2V3IJD5_9FLOR|nr:hypothetical protein BWQ96_08072 [Gracilariopsis chorda]|eukprot:PXF42204.1 hypothetical protein BWQ96_08072 [Gracilariopsis chorda]